MQSLKDSRCTSNKDVDDAFSTSFLPNISGSSSTNLFNGEFHNVPVDREGTSVNIEEVVPKSDGLSYCGIQFPMKDVASQCNFMQTKQVLVGNNTSNDLGTHEDHKCNHLVHKRGSPSCVTRGTQRMDACMSVKCKSGCILGQDIVLPVNQLVNIGHTLPLNDDSGDYSTASSPAPLNALASATESQPDEVAFQDRFVPLKTTQSIQEQARVIAVMKAEAHWSKVEESLRYKKELRNYTELQAWWKATPSSIRTGHA